MANRRRESVNLKYVIRLLVALVLTASVGGAQSRDTRTWYQAYRDAQTKVQQRDWQGALNDLDAAARAGAPRPGRNINFYGDTFATYNPEYYRGVALANLGRYAEADQALERVRAASLIDQKDSAYPEFVRLSASVKDSVKQLAAQNASATTQAQTASPSQTASAQASRPAAAGGVAAVTSGPPSGAQTPSQVAGAQPPINPATAGAPGTVSGGTTPAYTPANVAPANPNGAKAPPAGAKASPIPPSPRASTTSNTAVVPTPKGTPAIASSKEERAGLFAFYSGDYAGAVRILRGFANSGTASPRSLLYLASAEAALVLTGEWRVALMDRPFGSSADVVRDAQALAARVGDAAPYARDLALISPRIREQLGLRP